MAVFEVHSQGMQRAYRAAERATGESRESGREAFSSWGQKRFFWSTEDYSKPGFQESYIRSNFASRANAVYDVLQGLASEAPLANYTSQQELVALDFSGGPGCLADGTAQFLKERPGFTSSTLTIFDPVERWSIAVDYLNEQEQNFHFELQQKADLFEMATSTEVGRANIITIGSALVDFLDKRQVSEFWEEMARQVVSKESQLVVIVFDRFELLGQWLVSLPHVQPRSLGDKQGGLFPYAVYINLQGAVPHSLRETSTPAPSTPMPSQRQGTPMTPDPVRRPTQTSASISYSAASPVRCQTRALVGRSSSSASSSAQTDEQVFITKTGKKFHRETGCSAKNKWAVSRSHALSMNLTACQTCKP